MGDIDWLEGVRLPAGLPGTLALKRHAILCARAGNWHAAYRRLHVARTERLADERADADERARRARDPLVDPRGMRGGPGMPHPAFRGVPGIVGGDYDLYPGGIRPGGGGGFPRGGRGFPGGFPGGDGGFTGGGMTNPDEYGLPPPFGGSPSRGMGPLVGPTGRGQPGRGRGFPGGPFL